MESPGAPSIPVISAVNAFIPIEIPKLFPAAFSTNKIIPPKNEFIKTVRTKYAAFEREKNGQYATVRKKDFFLENSEFAPKVRKKKG